MLIAALTALAFLQPIYGQAERPAFEVASVKRSRPAGSQGVRMQFLPGGRLVATGLPLDVIISTAYELPFRSDRLTGGPEWIRSDAYDIEAAAGKDAMPPVVSLNARNRTIRLMLKTLLADRFRLRLRRETREAAVYAITVKKGGPKLALSRLTEKDCDNVATSPAPGDPEACHTFAGGAVQGLRARAASMSDLAAWMSNWVDRPVVDQTGLGGLFAIQTEGWLISAKPAALPEGKTAEEAALERPTVFQIFDRMGLKLEMQKAPVEFFVIESVERPSEN